MSPHNPCRPWRGALIGALAEVKAGHGAGRPLSKRIDEAVDQWAFIFWQLEMEQPAKEGRTAAPGC